MNRSMSVYGWIAWSAGYWSLGFGLGLLVACTAVPPSEAGSEDSTAMSTGEIQGLMVDAGTAEISLDEFRQAFMRLAELVDQRRDGLNAQDGGVTMTQRMAELTDEQLAIVYNATPDPRVFVDAVDRIVDRTTSAAVEPVEPPVFEPLEEHRPEDPFKTAYPEGGDYEVLLADLRSAGHVTDADQDGLFNDERCDSNKEAEIMNEIATIKLEIGAIVFVCEAFPEEFSESACYALRITSARALVIAETKLEKCALQDGLMDGAEIEATYENTLKIHRLILFQDIAFDELTDTVGQQSDVIKDAVVQQGDEIKDAVAQQGNEIKNVVVQQSQEIKNQVAEHDREVKARLDHIKEVVEENRRRLGEVLRLLHTPQGKRTTPIEVCDGAPCSWPEP